MKISSLLIVLFFAILISCNHRKANVLQIENSVNLESVLNSKSLVSDFTLFIKKTDSLQNTHINEGTKSDSSNIYWFIFYSKNDTCTIEIARLNFFSSDTSANFQYLGYTTYNNKLVLFYTMNCTPLFLNELLLIKHFPIGFPNQSSLEAIQSNHGGDYYMLKFRVVRNDSLELIGQNPQGVIRKI
jgi:hypothetical protein